jgi:UPF0755 protein
VGSTPTRAERRRGVAPVAATARRTPDDGNGNDGRDGNGGGREGNGRRGSGSGKPRRRRRRNRRVLIVLLVIMLPFLVVGGWFAYQLRPGSDGPAVMFKVQDGWGTSEIADALSEQDVIGNTLAFKVWATATGSSTFRPGCYDLHEGLGIRGAVTALEATPSYELNDGECVPRTEGGDYELLLPPGLTVNQIAARVEEQLPGHTAAKFLEVVNSGLIRSKYQPPEVTSLEGLLFPDTYFIGRTEDEESIVRRLVARFDEIGDSIGLANAQGLTPYETIIAASLIQTETKLAEDAPLISAVIRNRLNNGMQLQIDYTLCYAKGGCPPLPTDADKALVSPYNTYLVAGLPPTPIASVTQASLEAALAPANVPYLFYVVSDANGKHAFAVTLEEHDRNVAAAREKGL